MLKIRMQRRGRINMPSYRLIVVEHTEGPKTGNIVEKVGTYEPRSKTRALNEDRIKYWMSVGAKPSATVHNMLVSLGILNAKKINILPAYKAPAEAAAEEKAAEAEKAAEHAAKEAAKAAHDAAVAAEAAEKEKEADSTPSTSSGRADSPQAASEAVAEPAEAEAKKE
ncbi:30S ribosomal protein S16 [Candidatus Kaiserbacteria bacterium]|nr:30S ribosomal protein S16 [Candidatus Kaiserbacteria bacterium]